MTGANVLILEQMMYCIPIIAANTNEALKKMSEAEFRADIFEIRLDLMKSFDIGELIHSPNRPVLMTYRSEQECGKGLAHPGIRTEYLISASNEGAAYVDVELSMPEEYREMICESKGNSRIVISTHIGDRTPSNQALEGIFSDSVEAGADVVKIITWAKEWEDNLKVLELIPRAQKQKVEIVAFCMGPIGRISRIFSYLMGAHFTFTSLDTGQESAAGQIPEIEMRRMVEYFQP